MLENEKLKTDQLQNSRAAEKSVTLKKHIDEFMQNWAQILDYDFIGQLPQINSFQILREVQEQVFRTQSNSRDPKVKYRQTKNGENYRKLACVLLSMQQELLQAALDNGEQEPEIEQYKQDIC